MKNATLMSMLTRSEIKGLVNQYLLNAVSSEDTTFTSDKERVNYVISRYTTEYDHDYNKKVYPNRMERFSQWLMGLPSCFNIDFENYRIIELAKEWGAIPANATERQEDIIIANWFNYISNKFHQLHAHLNRPEKPTKRKRIQ